MRKTVVICDLCETDPREGASSIAIVLNGVEIAVDVCVEHLAALRRLPGVPRPTRARRDPKATKPAGAARGRAAPRDQRTTMRAVAATPEQGRQPGSRRDRQERIAQARAWARDQGRDVADRGRLPMGLLDEYEAAHS